MKKLFTVAFLLILTAGLTFAQSAAKKADNNVKQGNVKINSTTATNAVTYDFTTGADKYYGTNGAVELEAGVWGMIAGDADGSGVVDAADRSVTWNERNQTGYLGSDVNMSGVTEAGDRSTTWNNRNKSTAVPN